VREHAFAWADPDIFKVLPLPVLAGNLDTALQQPDTVVITQAAARKYFHRDLPIGDTLMVQTTTPLAQATVTGECQCQVAPIEQRGTLGAACTRIERGKLHCQYGVRGRPGLQLAMGAGRSLHPGQPDSGYGWLSILTGACGWPSSIGRLSGTPYMAQVDENTTGKGPLSAAAASSTCDPPILFS